MTDLDDAITALVTRISTGLAAITLGGRVYAYAVDSPNPPTAIVLPAEGDFVNYDVSMDGLDDYELVVKLLVGTANSKTAQQELQGYLARSGSTSVFAAINADNTLGGTVSDVQVKTARSYGDIEWAGITYFGAELVVTVYS